MPLNMKYFAERASRFEPAYLAEGPRGVYARKDIPGPCGKKLRFRG